MCSACSQRPCAGGQGWGMIYLDKRHRAAQFTVVQSVGGCAVKIPDDTLGEDILRKGRLCSSRPHKPGGLALWPQVQKQIKL